MSKKIYREVWLIVIALSFCSSIMVANASSYLKTALQERQITGKVKSEEGEVMPGVNIVIKGTTSGTVTDSNGDYKLNVPGNDVVLVFSFIGYSQEEVTVTNQTVIDVTLTASLETLSEIVVIGYGTVKKSDLTGSVSSIKAD